MFAEKTIELNSWLINQTSPELSQVRIVFEVQGTLKPSQDSDEGLPMKAVARLTYDEKISVNAENSQSLRFYHQAHAEIEVSKRGFERDLRSERAVVVCGFDKEKTKIFSPTGPFTRNELELLMVPANSLFLDSLLSKKTVEVGEAFSHEDDVLAKLMNFDAVTGNDVSSKVAAIEPELVRFTIKGKIVGAVDGVVADVELDGKYNFDRKQNRVTWLVLSIKENRATGPTKPGFNVTARIRLALEKNLDHTFLKAATAKIKNSGGGGDSLEYQPADSSFRFLYGRSWHVVSEIPKRSILRLVENGDTIAQCNIRELPKDESKKAISLKHFTSAIKKNLETFSPQILQSDESTNSSGLRVLRSVVAGSVSKTPVQWIYYHVNDKQGRSISFVFTMSGEMADEFASTDMDILNSLEIIDPANIRQAEQKAAPKR